MADNVFARFFKGEKDGSVMARLEGLVSFPERGWVPKPGETYEVEIVGRSKSGKAQFLRRIAGPFYAVEGSQRQYGWYNTSALGSPDVEFQSGFSRGSSYYTAVWTSMSHAEALRRVGEVRRKDEEAEAEKARLQEERGKRREAQLAAFHLARAQEPEILALINGMLADAGERFRDYPGEPFSAKLEATWAGLSITIVRYGTSGAYDNLYLQSYSNCLTGEWRRKKYTFPHKLPELE